MTETDALRGRFAATAARLAELEESRRAELTERVRRFVQPTGDERALDAGTGTGALAFALAPHVREVVAVDVVPELLAEARKRAGDFPNVTFREGDATRLPPDLGAFDLAGSLRTLHHIRRPELAVAELRRATRWGGRILVADLVAPADPLVALDLDRFERTRDPSHQRTLSDADFRHFFEANDLRLVRAEFETRATDLDAYLDLAGCEGDEREAAQALAPRRDSFPVTVGWYLLAR
ncbi:MAG TPA: methyltransferase domain-containing protein [Candidatus Limnocylindria bacterium]|nr:methyltransferase domain-containing protein [Candidatus Limnocylindria bacterium]